MKLPARVGNAAQEYAVPLVVFVLLAGAITHYADLPEAIARHFGLPPDSRPMKERISVDIYSSLEVYDPDPLDETPGTPQVVRHPLGKVRLLLNSGDTITFENYPMNLPELADSEGVSGVTRRYADALDKLIAKLEDTGELQAAEVVLLRQITAQAKVMAQTEAEVETWIRREESTLPTGVRELGFSRKVESAAASTLGQLSPNTQSRTMLTLLEAAREGRALRDRAVERFVTEVVTRILLASEALENTISDDSPGEQPSKAELLEELRRLNPCEQKLEESERLFCPKA